MLAALFVFILVAGLVLGGYVAVGRTSTTLARRRLERRLLEVGPAGDRVLRQPTTQLLDPGPVGSGESLDRQGQPLAARLREEPFGDRCGNLRETEDGGHRLAPVGDLEGSHGLELEPCPLQAFRPRGPQLLELLERDLP